MKAVRVILIVILLVIEILLLLILVMEIWMIVNGDLVIASLLPTVLLLVLITYLIKRLFKRKSNQPFEEPSSKSSNFINHPIEQGDIKTSTMTYFYYMRGNKKVGPVDKDTLASAKISKNTRIWKQGLMQWVKVSDLPELDYINNQEPPQIPLGRRMISKLASLLLSIFIVGGVAAFLTYSFYHAYYQISYPIRDQKYTSKLRLSLPAVSMKDYFIMQKLEDDTVEKTILFGVIVMVIGIAIVMIRYFKKVRNMN